MASMGDVPDEARNVLSPPYGHPSTPSHKGFFTLENVLLRVKTAAFFQLL
jgi:hypothetical protein